MSSTYTYFIVKAENDNQAKMKVLIYLETEYFYEDFDVLSTFSLSEKRKGFSDLYKFWNWNDNADEYLKLAEKEKSKGNFIKCGNLLIDAGNLYAQKLTISTCIFNLDFNNYSIPEDDKDWRVIEVCFYS